MKSLAKRIGQAAGAALLALLLHGCSTTYEMQVDAIKNPEPIAEGAESYVLVPRDPSTDVNELRYKETVNWIKTALSAKGYYEATDPLAADMVIEVDYGMEAPRQEVRIVEEPVYVRRQEPGYYQSVPMRDANGNVRMVQVYVPGRVSSELAGYQQRAITTIVNEKYLVLTAKQNTLAADGDTTANEMWSVTVVNEDSSDNLREYLPIMAASATDYIGEDTGAKKSVRLKSDDEVVAFVKQGLAK